MSCCKTSDERWFIWFALRFWHYNFLWNVFTNIILLRGSVYVLYFLLNCTYFFRSEKKLVISISLTFTLIFGENVMWGSFTMKWSEQSNSRMLLFYQTLSQNLAGLGVIWTTIPCQASSAALGAACKRAITKCVPNLCGNSWIIAVWGLSMLNHRWTIVNYTNRQIFSIR